MQLSENAYAMMRYLANWSVEKGYPPHRTWWFQRPENDTTFPGLANGHGLIRLTGSARAGKYTLSDHGHRWVMEHRQDDAASA